MNFLSATFMFLAHLNVSLLVLITIPFSIPVRIVRENVNFNLDFLAFPAVIDSLKTHKG